MFERLEDECAASSDSGEERPIRCRSCAVVVADESAVFGEGGRPAVATFFNPSGELMEVMTVRTAPGLRPVGRPTSDFSWFPGTSWTVGACVGCGLQLGWWYRRTEGGEFAGLITERVLCG